MVELPCESSWLDLILNPLYCVFMIPYYTFSWTKYIRVMLSISGVGRRREVRAYVRGNTAIAHNNLIGAVDVFRGFGSAHRCVISLVNF